VSFIILCFCASLISCINGESNIQANSTVEEIIVPEIPADPIPGSYRMQKYLPMLKGKNVALVANHTSLIEGVHLVDSLRNLDINITKVFAPEHGFRGSKDAGETVENQTDDSGLEIISLYGKNKKPSRASLNDVDIVVFDIQDVGVRFYTYLSTLHYVMEACAETNKKLVVLDRPNPNGHYIDGPVLKTNERSFIGLHPVPIVYGLTIGEYAKMINGEKWLENGVQCHLTVVYCENYTHQTEYELPVSPSPNLPNLRSIYLYPSLALFEGTSISIGRGTDFPFQVIGHPKLPKSDFNFTPTSGYGAKYPKLEGKKCNGSDLRMVGLDTVKTEEFNLKYLINTYNNSSDKRQFFLKNKFFNKLAGNSLLMAQIKMNLSEEAIRATWETDLNIYLRKRQKYLVYED